MKEDHGSLRYRAGYFWTLVLRALVFVFVSLAAPGASIAQMRPDIPIQFKIKGEFYDPEQNPEKGGVNALTANVEGKKWILDIERADALKGGVPGSTVINKIYPPTLTFVGPKELTSQLTGPDTAGKSFTMTGQLYLKTRMFRLESVESSEEGGEGEPASAPQAKSRPVLPASSPPTDDP
ncbi:MAG: hypothetical protein AB1640_22520 [bacterium]